MTVETTVKDRNEFLTRKKHFGFGMMIVAAVFLFNPDFTVIDLLPDFIGYLFMWIGLGAIADINDHIEDARNRFKLMIFVGLAKTVSIFLLFGLNDPYMLPYSYLLYPFAFSVIDLVLLIPAFNSLFDGIIYLTARHDGTHATLYTYPKSKKKYVGEKNITARVQSATLFFIVAKSVLSFAPELSALTISSYDESKRYIDLYEYVGLLRLFAITAGIILGIIWIKHFTKYFRFLCKDSTLIANIKDIYRSRVSPNKGLHIRRGVNTGFAFLMISAVLFIDFYVDYVNILPDAVAVLFALLGMTILRRFISKIKYTTSMITLSALGCSYIVSSVINLVYDERFGSFGYITKNEEAYDLFLAMCGSTAAEGIIFVLAIASILWALMDIVRNHCGYVGRDWDSEFAKEQHQKLISELKSPLRFALVFSAASAVMTFIYDFTKQYRNGRNFLPDWFIKDFPKFSSIIRRSMPGTVGILDFVVALCFVISVGFALSDIKYSVEQRYYLD